jgi:TetR/AcrR family transcriptional regulator, transcriptional repressor for nem operon
MANTGTREKIIEAAYLRFYEFGYNGTSVQDIVDLVGVPKGTFYNYFKSKELLGLEALDLYACVADKVFTPPEVSQRLPKSKKPQPSQIARIRSQFEEALRFQERQKISLGCLMGNFTAESSALPESFGKLIQKNFNRWIAAISASLKLAQQNGEVAQSHDPDSLARYLMAAWFGSLLLMKNSQSRTPIDDFFRLSFDTLVKSEPPTGKRKVLQRRKDK